TQILSSQGYSSHECSLFLHISLSLSLSKVTARGFEPLLQFAYTSKLLFSKDNVTEIRHCASILGFRDLDSACFDFLLPKFFSSSTASFQRKVCCNTRCRRQSPRAELSDIDTNKNVLDDDKVVQVVSDSPDVGGAPCQSSQPTNGVTGCKSETPAPPPEVNIQSDAQTDYSLRCPEYCKFQLACGKDHRVGVAEERREAERVSGVGCLISPLMEVSSGMTVSCEQSPGLDEGTVGTASHRCPLEEPGLGHQSPGGVGEGGCVLGGRGHHEGLDPAVSNSSQPKTEQEQGGRERRKMDRDQEQGGRERREMDRDKEQGGRERRERGCEERSSMEREVAEHLAHGLWSDLSSPPPPLLQDSLPETGPETLPGCEGSSQSEKSPCVSSLTSGDDGDSDCFDTEGDSESCSYSQRTRELQLPFSVGQILALSRNDFQLMLRHQTLTREQLDFVHDVRRRSRNRSAAQRCRKRKLDCIHNLECAIDKLRTEKDQLMSERTHLIQMKLKTWQSVSELCQRVCSESDLRPEQLQVLASPYCPLSALISPTDPASPGLEGLLQPLASLSTCSSASKPL
uniref:BZIP domain-containing protein n=1 Tax=Hucho hucho TaxID=62062 RepID=A0A4W5JUR3_9TELE